MGSIKLSHIAEVLPRLRATARTTLPPVTKTQAEEAAHTGETTLLTTADPPTLEGERDDPESALANLITLLEAAGILVDETTETAA